MEMVRAMSKNAHGTCAGYMQAICGTDKEGI